MVRVKFKNIMTVEKRIHFAYFSYVGQKQKSA